MNRNVIIFGVVIVVILILFGIVTKDYGFMQIAIPIPIMIIIFSLIEKYILSEKLEGDI